MNIQLSDHDWAISWVDFLHSADTAMLGCLIQKLSEAKGVIDHLMIRAEGLGIDWLYCLYGVDDYRRKLQNEIDRRTVLSKPSTTARPGEGYFEQTYITPGDRAGQQPQNESRAMEGSHPSGGGVSAISQQPAASIHVLPDRQGRGPSSTPGRVHETTSIPVNNRDDAREDAEAMHQHRNEEIDQLSEEWTHLLAGWCRLGQQGESNVWIKVFCILYALASVGIEPSEAASGI